MEISDITQIKDKKNVEITFCDESEYYYDCAKIIISIKDMWQIHDFCQSQLSYGAQLKKQKQH